MTRAILAAFALITGASGATLIPARAPTPLPVARPTATPGASMTVPAPTPPVPAASADPAEASQAIDTPVPTALPPSGAVNLARSSPAQSRVNLTPTTAVEIAAAQLAMQGLGLYRGPINGVMTGPTRAGLRVFQAQARLPVTGHLDLRTIAVLGVEDQGTSSNPAVTAEQLQIEAGLPVTGEIDEATLEVLREGVIPQENGFPGVRFRDTLPMVLDSP